MEPGNRPQEPRNPVWPGTTRVIGSMQASLASSEWICLHVTFTRISAFLRDPPERQGFPGFRRARISSAVLVGKPQFFAPGRGLAGCGLAVPTTRTQRRRESAPWCAAHGFTCFAQGFLAALGMTVKGYCGAGMCARSGEAATGTWLARALPRAATGRARGGTDDRLARFHPAALALPYTNVGGQPTASY